MIVAPISLISDNLPRIGLARDATRLNLDYFVHELLCRNHVAFERPIPQYPQTPLPQIVISA